MIHLKLFAIAAVAFLSLDLLWLGVLARDHYRHHLGSLMREQTDWVAALLFYIIFLAGLVFFVVKPSLDSNGWDVLLRGAFFGLVTYSTYDLVNRAVIVNFSWTIVITDILWGVFLCAVVSWLSWYFGS